MAGRGHGGIRKGPRAALLAESRYSIALVLALHARVAVCMRARAKTTQAGAADTVYVRRGRRKACAGSGWTLRTLTVPQHALEKPDGTDLAPARAAAIPRSAAAVEDGILLGIISRPCF